jgi:hypothetical protein
MYKVHTVIHTLNVREKIVAMAKSPTHVDGDLDGYR